MAEQRREALKIMGAIGVSCMFPYQADELYGQHQHEDGKAAAMPVKPRVFDDREFALITRVADLIIPATDTPGAVGAGVPIYIDMVAGANEGLKNVLRSGLSWLAGTGFATAGGEGQVAVLETVCRSAEMGAEGVPERFWRAIKAMTADGYYTSQIGLREELGYKGNTVMERFPESRLADG